MWKIRETFQSDFTYNMLALEKLFLSKAVWCNFDIVFLVNLVRNVAKIIGIVEQRLTYNQVFYKKQKPTIITYRSYKNFSNEVFMADFQNRISQVTSENNDLEFDIFKAVLNQAIQKHAPIKQ